MGNENTRDTGRFSESDRILAKVEVQVKRALTDIKDNAVKGESNETAIADLSRACEVALTHIGTLTEAKGSAEVRLMTTETKLTALDTARQVAEAGARKQLYTLIGTIITALAGLILAGLKHMYP